MRQLTAVHEKAPDVRICREADCPLICVVGGGAVAEASAELGPGSPERLIRFDTTGHADGIQCRDAGGRSVHGGEYHGAVRRHHIGSRSAEQVIVQQEERRPVRRPGAPPGAVYGLDRGLQLEASRPFDGRGASEEPFCLVDQGAVPCSRLLVG